MDGLSEREALLLALLSVPGLGERGLGHLLDSGIPLPRIFGLPAEELQGRFGLTRHAAETLAGGRERVRALVPHLEREVRRYGIRLLERGGAGYPAALAARPEAPPVLTAYGSLRILEVPGVALLCSGGETRLALEFAAALAAELASRGAAIVSGHNRPGYRAAASAAKAVGGCRVIVLDRGLLEAFGGDLDRDLFPTARVWGYHLDPQRTLVLSPYRLDAHHAGLNNRRRDRLVALLAERIVAIRVRADGAMAAECRGALSRGTPVHVCAGPDVGDGNGALLAEGFTPLDMEAGAARCAEAVLAGRG